MTCPICRIPSDATYRPFCSRRCADVDLGRWLIGSYIILGSPADQVAGPAPEDNDRDPSTF